jgi:outer membrane receptor for ferrienterochelin and colicins
MHYEDDEGILQEGYVQGYNNLDLSVGKSFFSKNVQFTAGVKNLLDLTSIDALAPGVGHSGGASGSRNVGYGRTFFVSLSYNFQKF